MINVYQEKYDHIFSILWKTNSPKEQFITPTCVNTGMLNYKPLLMCLTALAESTSVGAARACVTVASPSC